jgi:hypothetical protein
MKKEQTESRRKRAPASKPAGTPKEPAARKALSGSSDTELRPEEINQMIAAGAYLRSQRRGFEPGHEVEDWLAAEREVREKLAGGPSRAKQ